MEHYAFGAYFSGFCIGVGLMGMATSFGSPLQGAELVFPITSIVVGIINPLMFYLGEWLNRRK
jgi:hypothetical protein